MRDRASSRDHRTAVSGAAATRTPLARGQPRRSWCRRSAWRAVSGASSKREGLPRDCVVNCDWLVTVPKADLVERAGILSAAKLRQVDDALRFALGLGAHDR